MTDPFYRSLAWRRLCAAVAKRSRGMCEAPGCRNKGRVVDHVVSRRRGGPDSLSNLRHLCASCDNRIKEDQHGRRRSQGIMAGCDVHGVPSDPNHPWNGGRNSAPLKLNGLMTPTGSNMSDFKGLDRPGARVSSKFGKG